MQSLNSTNGGDTDPLPQLSNQLKNSLKIQQPLNLDNLNNVTLTNFQSKDIQQMMSLCEQHLSEPYSIYTYRYFLSCEYGICYFAYHNEKLCGIVLGKIKPIKDRKKYQAANLNLIMLNAKPSPPPSPSGYIGMIVVDPEFRKFGIGSKLLDKLMNDFNEQQCDKVTLETEVSNTTALRFYERYGFIRTKKHERYYLNGSAAYKLCLKLK